MGKSMKSAIVVDACALLCALAFLVAHFVFGVGREDPFVNIVTLLLSVLAVALVMLLLWRRTLLREVLVRRFMSSPEWIYNTEIGYAPIARVAPGCNAYDLVTFIAEALANMSYGFEVADSPASFSPVLIIDSDTFLFHMSEDDGVVVDEWSGYLSKVAHKGRSIAGEQVGAFTNAGELARLLDDIASGGSEAMSALTEDVR